MKGWMYIEVEVWILLKLDCYSFELDHYKLKMLIVVPRVTTKKITLKYTKKKKSNENGIKMVH
jgi:hypothetical protein